MRLINCITFEFEEHYQPETLVYATLSHRWQDNEVSYQDMLGDRSGMKNRDGYRKIAAFRKMALKQDVPYIWVDTCCIDKSSSAELSEAINSMYSWYCASSVCHVYLHDFEVEVVEEVGLAAQHTRSSITGRPGETETRLRQCSWFYRGWTLQELIGPWKVLFYDRNWRPIGDKHNMAPMLSRITGIPEDVLTKETAIESLPIAQKMTWAGRRECTRLEDTAYSLLGLFDINMPMLYGEGSKAFRRLQEAIIQRTNDHTIFLWQIAPLSPSSMFATHPSAFNMSMLYRRRAERWSKFSISNMGLTIDIQMRPWLPGIYTALLDCEVAHENDPRRWYRPGIFLRKNVTSGMFERVILPDNIFSFVNPGAKIPISCRRMNIDINLRDIYLSNGLELFNGFHIKRVGLNPEVRMLSYSMEGFAFDEAHQVNEETSVASLPAGQSGPAVEISVGPQDIKLITHIKLGFDFDFRPTCVLRTNRCGGALHSLACTNYLKANLMKTSSPEEKSTVTDKAYTLIDFMETFGWEEDHWLDIDEEDRRCTYYLKPPEHANLLGHAPSMARGDARQMRLILYDRHKQRWSVTMRFEKDVLPETSQPIWGFSIWCKPFPKDD